MLLGRVSRGILLKVATSSSSLRFGEVVVLGFEIAEAQLLPLDRDLRSLFGSVAWRLIRIELRWDVAEALEACC